MNTQRVAIVYPRDPLTRNSEGQPGEQEITNQTAPPFGDPTEQEGAIQVATIKGVDECGDGEVAALWQFRTRMTWTQGDGEATAYLWGYSRHSRQWGPIQQINFLPQVPVGVVSGSILHISGILGLIYIYMQVSGITGDERIFLELIPG